MIRIRFYFDTQDGTQNGHRGWLIDDVKIYANNPTYIPTPLRPINGTTVIPSIQTFTWDSIEPSYGPLNYTWQLSNTSTFSSILDEMANIPEVPGNTSVLSLVDYLTGSYFWRVRATYGLYTSNWSVPFILNIDRNDFAPILSAGQINPSSGSELTSFNLSVVYTDADNDAPSSINVTINGTAHAMVKQNPLDLNYVDGCIYVYISLLPLGNNSFQFWASDGLNINNTDVSYILVTSSNVFTPWISNASVNPGTGSNTTLFTFSAWYFDADNSPPSIVNITINAATYNMNKVNASDTNAVDGIEFRFQTTLAWGYYSFVVHCFDGIHSNSTLPITGPEVNPLYAHNEIYFYDNFDDGSFGTDWTTTGYAGINSMTCNSTPYSAYHCGDPGSITSRVINLSGRTAVNASYWIRCGGSFSEQPDAPGTEDLVVEYYASTGTWVQLEVFPAGSTAGQIFTRNIQLPANAFHAAFQIRFRQVGGSGSDYDYWHIDDVGIFSKYRIIPIYPTNGTTLTAGSINFRWTSLNLPAIPINYTWQISNTRTFAMVLDEVTGIPETPGSTNRSIVVNFPTGPYFWRVQATYSVFTSNWSAPFVLNILSNDYTPSIYATVTPTVGINSTVFDFSAWYFDLDNSPPSIVNITINATTYNMNKVNVADMNAVDGIEFRFQTTLAWGDYQFNVECSDGLYTNSTGWISGPEVNPFSSGVIQVAILDAPSSPSYFSGGYNSTFSSGLVTYLNGLGMNASSITNAQINAGLLANYDVLVLTDNAPDATCLTAIRNAWAAGLGILTFDSSICALPYFGLLPQISQGTNGQSTYWSYGSTSQTAIAAGHPITADYTVGQILSGTSGDASWISSAMSATAEAPYLVPLATVSGTPSLWTVLLYDPPSSGSIVMIWDDDHMYNVALRPMIEDAINYVARRRTPSLMPLLISPANGSTAVCGAVNFTWQSLDNPFVAIEYTWQISNTRSFAIVLNEVSGIPETPVTISRSIVANYTTGAYFWRVRATYGVFASNWSAPFTLNLLANNYAPVLSLGSVNPAAGNQLTSFNFSVVYTDADNNPPASINVTINGMAHMMAKQNPGDINYADGCIYVYVGTLLPGNDSYRFQASDGLHVVNTGMSYILVSETNANPPWIANAAINPARGTNTTIFTFSAWYFDSDNNQPRIVNVTINATTYNMNKVNASDTNAVDGIEFRFQTTLACGYYSFVVRCFDGFYSNSTLQVTGPEVNPFYGYNEIYFYDDFNDGSFGTDWITTGYAGINSMTCNSTPYSAYHDGGAGTITSRAINLNWRTAVNVSYWIRRGDYSFSELPDIGEDLVVEYYSNTGTWVQLATYTGGGTGGQVYFINIQLPVNALHTAFQIQFRQTGGSGSGMDYWHIDDVGIFSSKMIKLVLPNNGSIDWNGPFNFRWTSLGIPMIQTNYTWQISNTSTFVTVLDEITGILETPVTTSRSIVVNYTTGTYFWRIRATSGAFTSNWSVPFVLNEIQNDRSPVLSFGNVNPAAGNQLTSFIFSVVYSDADNNSPASINVTINGTAHAMAKQNSGDMNFTDGCVYVYSSAFLPGNYSFQFRASDGLHLGNTVISYVLVSETNANPPWISNAAVNPARGTNTTIFTFSAWYFDSDNNQPRIVNVTINATTYNMNKVNASDTNAVDGIEFRFQTTLTWGYYSFVVRCFDGTYSSSTLPMTGPEVNPLYAYNEIYFYDNFDDGSFGTDWTTSGYAGISDATCNSYPNSAYHCGDPGSITSREINLSGLTAVNASYWIRRGGSFSEQPDVPGTEDLVVEYYASIGTWVQLEVFPAGGTDGEIFTRNIQLPANALHAAFRMRFRQVGGSGSGMDYWHIDDVMISSSKMITLLSPHNAINVKTGATLTFCWRSLSLSAIPVNYTLVISDIPDFSHTVLEIQQIPETLVTTNVSVYLGYPVHNYYWRVRATSGMFNSGWSSGSMIRLVSDSPPPTVPDFVVYVILISCVGLAIIIGALVVRSRRSRKVESIREKPKKSAVPRKTPAITTTTEEAIDPIKANIAIHGTETKSLAWGKTTAPAVQSLEEISSRLKHLFVFHIKSSVCLFYQSFTEVTIDPQLIAGFVSALMSFGTSFDKGAELKVLEYKAFKVLLEETTTCRYALLFTGEVNNKLTEFLRDFISEFESKYKEDLTRFNGNVSAFNNASDILTSVFKVTVPRTNLAFEIDKKTAQRATETEYFHLYCAQCKEWTTYPVSYVPSGEDICKKCQQPLYFVPKCDSCGHDIIKHVQDFANFKNSGKNCERCGNRIRIQ